MTASLATPVAVGAAADASAALRSPAPASLAPADYASAVARGAVVVDLRTHEQRSAAGTLPGALAIPPELALARLDPASPARLAAATPVARWVLVSEDGTLAAVAVRALQALGVRAAAHLDGGFRALERHRQVAAGAGAAHVQREAAAIAAH